VWSAAPPTIILTFIILTFIILTMAKTARTRSTMPAPKKHHLPRHVGQRARL